MIESFQVEAKGGHIFVNVPDAGFVVESIDRKTGAEVARLRAAGECDDVYFDASRKRVYVIGGAGAISVFQEVDPDHL